MSQQIDSQNKSLIQQETSKGFSQIIEINMKSKTNFEFNYLIFHLVPRLSALLLKG